MNKIILMLLLLSLFFTYFKSSAQNKTYIGTNNICWQEGKKLKWKDFQAKLNPLIKNGNIDSVSTAYCRPGVYVKPIIDSDSRDNFLVSAYLNKSTAWVKDSNSVISYAILAHEQLHFDICELVARKIRAKILQVYKAGGEVYGLELSKEIDEFFMEMNYLQDAYDRETDHGKIVAQQRVWSERIKLELTKLKTYKSTSATCQL